MNPEQFERIDNWILELGQIERFLDQHGLGEDKNFMVETLQNRRFELKKLLGMK